MERKGAGRFATWVLFCALGLGIVAMHHVGSEPGAGHHEMAAGTVVSLATAGSHAGPGHSTDHHGPHELFHSCLAILLGLIALALLRLLRNATGETCAPVRRKRPSRGFARAPPFRAGRDFLHLACVLRL
ncbi:hypothetical protein [Amycolatopsis nigrescens]|uniref:hypothetical protein n=1 Tax=Amycolatopsis nigrescens TaxID=381445 RepID=UPI0003786937|nr:hypothetical protein [Amycolatopsis nigrescens]